MRPFLVGRKINPSPIEAVAWILKCQYKVIGVVGQLQKSSLADFRERARARARARKKRTL